MESTKEWEIAITALGLLLAASSLSAQAQTETTAPAADLQPAETRPNDPEESQSDNPANRPFDALAACRETTNNLRAVIAEGFTCPEPPALTANPDILRLRTELEQCRDDERLNRTTNQRLNNELVECREETGIGRETESEILELTRERDTALKELASAQVDLDAANSEIEALTERLASSGLGAEPGFRYVGSVDASYVRRNVADTSVRNDLKLPASRCEEAIDWLDTQKGTDLWLRKLVWVWSNDGAILLCGPTASGAIETTAASPSDEAHAVTFK